MESVMSIPQASPAGDRPGRILVVDDSWVILDKIRLELLGAGYEVRTATTLETAVVAVNGVDLAIVDFHMPGRNGSELVAEVRRTLPAGSRCLFYLYTSDRNVAMRYDTHGFDGALLRKGEEGALLAQVDAVFRTVRLRLLGERMRAARENLEAAWALSKGSP